MSAGLVRRVVAWYATAQRPLPWRQPGTTPWGVLVSEFMCQQTQVDRVAPRWQAWLDRWPAPSALAADSPAEAIRAWDRLGYPRRARWLHASAAQIAADHADEVPADTSALLALPGVGEYTAAAVQAFAFGMPSIVLDTNVRRVLARSLEGVATPRPSVSNGERVLAQRMVSQADTQPGQAAVWSQAVMELGALVCTARNPACDHCPIRTMCAWHKGGRPPAAWTGRKQSAFNGSDRQARGRIMAVVRAAHAFVPRSAVEEAVADAEQCERALAGLLADGLLEQTAAGDFRLPLGQQEPIAP